MSKPSALVSFAGKRLGGGLDPVNRAEVPDNSFAKLKVSPLKPIGENVADRNAMQPASPRPPTKGGLNPISKSPRKLNDSSGSKKLSSTALTSFEPPTSKENAVASDQVEKPRRGSDQRGLMVLPGISASTVEAPDNSPLEIREPPPPQTDQSNDVANQSEKSNADKSDGVVDAKKDSASADADFNFDDVGTPDKQESQNSTVSRGEEGKPLPVQTEERFPPVDIDELYDCPSDPNDQEIHATTKREPTMFLPRASDIELFHVFLEQDTERLKHTLEDASPEEILGVVDSAGRTLYHYATLSRGKLEQEIVFQHVNLYRETQLEAEIEALMHKKLQLNTWIEETRTSGKEWIPPRVKELQREMTKQKCADWEKICTSVDQYNRSIFHYIATKSSAIPMEDDYEFCSVLRSKPEILSAKDDFKKLALHYAVNAGNIKQVKWYFQMGIKLSHADIDILLSFNISRVMEKVLLRQLEEIDLQTFYRPGRTQDEDTNAIQCGPGISTFVLAKMHKSADSNAGRLHQTPLHRAAMYGNIHAVELLLEQDADPNARDANQWTPLHYCADEATANDLAIAKLLFDSPQPVDINAKSLKGRTPLHIAGRLSTHRKFVNEDDLPSFEACEVENRVAFIEYLYSCKADLDIKDTNGETPLLLACRGDSVELVKSLLKAGCDPTTRSHSGWNALHVAASRGYPSTVVFLLSWDADSQLWFHSPDLQGRKPADVTRNDKQLMNLWTECYKGNVEQVKCLLTVRTKGDAKSVSCSVTAKTVQTERTPLHLAVLGYMNILDSKFPRNSSSSRGEHLKQTELVRTAPNRYLQIVVLLIQAGADLSAGDKWGLTALMLATCVKDSAFMETFLDRITSEDELCIVDSDGNTAVHYSYAFCQAKLSTMLEDQMDDGEIENNQGKTPFEVTGYKDKLFPKEYREFVKQQQSRQATSRRKS